MIGTDLVFQRVVDALVEYCGTLSAGLRGGQPRWALREDLAKYDDAGWHAVFDRSELERVYVSALQSGDGSRQDLALATVQSDFLSGLERDFAARRRSRIRRLAHETAARAAAGTERGILNAGLLFYVQQQSRRARANGNRQ